MHYFFDDKMSLNSASADVTAMDLTKEAIDRIGRLENSTRLSMLDEQLVNNLHPIYIQSEPVTESPIRNPQS